MIRYLELNAFLVAPQETAKYSSVIHDIFTSV